MIAIVLPLFMGNVARTAGWIIILDNKGLLNFLVQKFDLTEYVADGCSIRPAR